MTRESGLIIGQLDERGQKVSLSELVYEYIRDEILRQRIACGERIPEEKIACRLGVSRTPIREALRRLAKEGLVNLYPRRYAEVVTFTKKDINDLGLIRISLDTIAVQLAVQYGSNDDIDRLWRMAEECYNSAAGEDAYEWIRQECEFHLGLARVGRNENMVRILEDLYQKIRLFQFVNYGKKDLAESLKMIELHFKILEELRNRDLEKVIRHIQTHLAYFYDLDKTHIRTTVLGF